MSRRFTILIPVLSAGVLISGYFLFNQTKAAGIDPALFAITPEDEGKISREFIDKIRAGVGDEKASRASAELDHFVKDEMVTDQMTGFEVNRLYSEYINYLERLRQKAIKAAAEKMKPEEREAFLRKEDEWLEKFVNGYEYEIRNPEGRLIVDIEPLSRKMRIYLNRVRYLESPPERRAELDRFHGLKVRYVRGKLPVEYNELRRETPLAVGFLAPVDEDKYQKLAGKNYIEEIATMPVEFCREVRIGQDLYQMGMLFPTDDIATERSTWGTEVILVVWRNGEHYSVFYLPNRSIVQEMKVHGSQVSIRYLQQDEHLSENVREKDAEQTYTIDFTYEVYAPVRITNWLNYYMDGLGNIHDDGCCKSRYDNF